MSRFRGRGVDFLESRHYLVGDDIRNLDWKVTARTGKAHTKVFQEERERPIIVLLDLSPTMYFATQGRLKATIATHMAALIAWAAVGRGDRIGGIVLAADEQLEIRPRGGRRGALRFIKQLQDGHNRGLELTKTERLVRLEEGLASLRRVARPGSLVFVLSDFYDLNSSCDQHLSYLRQHQDILAFQILDRSERQLLPGSVYPVSDGRKKSFLDLTRNTERQRLQKRLDQIVEGARQELGRFAIPMIDVATTADPRDTLLRWFSANSGQA